MWIVALSFPNGFKTRVNGRNEDTRAASRKTSLKIASRGLKDGVHLNWPFPSWVAFLLQPSC